MSTTTPAAEQARYSRDEIALMRAGKWHVDPRILSGGAQMPRRRDGKAYVPPAGGAPDNGDAA